MKTYWEKARQIPVGKEVDVLVAGAGTAGLAAAVAAGRNGARTLLIERNGMVGGVATAGLMLNWGIRNRYWDSTGEQVVTGIPLEISKRISARNPLKFDFSSYENSPVMLTFDSETLKRTAVEMLLEAGVEVLLHTLVCDVIQEGRLVQGVIIENKSGRQAILASQFIDATGDADLCAFAGAAGESAAAEHTFLYKVAGVEIGKTYDFLSEHRELIRSKSEKHLKNENWQAFSERWAKGGRFVNALGYDELLDQEPFRPIYEAAIRDGYFTADQLNIQINRMEQGKDHPIRWGIDMQGFINLPGSDLVDVCGPFAIFDGTDAEQVSKAEIHANRTMWDFFEHILVKLPGFEQARIVESAADFGVRRSRAVRTGYLPVVDDVRAGLKQPDSIGRLADTLILQPGEKVRGFDIPFRMLLPEALDNVAVVGKPHDARYNCNCLRSMTGCMITGEAGGTAAAVAAGDNVPLRLADLGKLQEALRKQGVNL